MLKVTSRDEIGDLAQDFNKMKENMIELLTHVNRSTEHVASSAEEAICKRRGNN